MAKSRITPEQGLMKALEHLKKLGEPVDLKKARERIGWDSLPTDIEENQQMEQINFAAMSKYIIHAVAAKEETMKGIPKHVSRISWSISTRSDNEPVVGSSADSIEQAMRFGEIAYRTLYGLEYKGDA